MPDEVRLADIDRRAVQAVHDARGFSSCRRGGDPVATP